MQDKRVTIRIPFETWKALRELQTTGKISSIQQAAVIGINKLIESLPLSAGQPILAKANNSLTNNN